MLSSEENIKISKKIYLLGIGLLIAQGFIIILTYFYTSNQKDVADIALFAGRFHPMILHMPIGFLTLLFLLRLWLFYTKSSTQNIPLLFLWILTNLSISGAAFLGLLLGSKGDYDAHLLNDHRNSGTVLALLFIVSTLFYFHYNYTHKNIFRTVYRVCFVLSFAILPLVGHDGGSLTHGSKYLFEYMPEFISSKMTQEKPDNNSKDIDKEVLAILESKCFKCHGEEKQKGDYRLDKREHALKAGDSEIEGIIPENAIGSNLFYLITLAKDEDEIMPPEGKGELSAEEIMKIKHWIDRGAKYGK